MAPTLRHLIDDHRVHLFDGAMGTMLYAKGFFLNVCYDELCVKQPQLVREVHEEYVRAGAEIIETNTFGATPLKLGAHGLADQTREINRAAAQLARAAAGDRVTVVGAIGPLGVRVEPFGPTSRDEARDLFRRQVDGLLEGGVDGFVLETFSDVEELLEKVGARKDDTVLTADLPGVGHTNQPWSLGRSKSNADFYPGQQRPLSVFDSTSHHSSR